MVVHDIVQIKEHQINISHKEVKAHSAGDFLALLLSLQGGGEGAFKITGNTCDKALSEGESQLHFLANAELDLKSSNTCTEAFCPTALLSAEEDLPQKRIKAVELFKELETFIQSFANEKRLGNAATNLSLTSKEIELLGELKEFLQIFTNSNKANAVDGLIENSSTYNNYKELEGMLIRISEIIDEKSSGINPADRQELVQLLSKLKTVLFELKKQNKKEQNKAEQINLNNIPNSALKTETYKNLFKESKTNSTAAQNANTSIEPNSNIKSTKITNPKNQAEVQLNRQFALQSASQVSGSAVSAKISEALTPNQFASRILDAAESMFARQQNQTTVLRLKLHPEHLGEVTVRLVHKLGTTARDASLNVQFYVSNALAKDAVESILPQIRDALFNQLKNSDVSIFYSGQNNSEGDLEHSRFKTRAQHRKGSKEDIKGLDEVNAVSGNEELHYVLGMSAVLDKLV